MIFETLPIETQTEVLRLTNDFLRANLSEMYSTKHSAEVIVILAREKFAATEKAKIDQAELVKAYDEKISELNANIEQLKRQIKNQHGH